MTLQTTGTAPDIAALFNEVFRQLRVIFPALSATIRDRETLDVMRREWVKAFAEQGIKSSQQIQAGLSIAREQPTPFAPSPGQFIRWCGEGINRLAGLPDESTLFREFKTYCAKRGGYDCPEDYPFATDALYWLVTTLYDEMRAYRLDPDAVERKGKALLAEMSKNLAAGVSVRRPVRRLKKPDHPSGPTPAQLLHAEYLRRQAAGWFNK